MGIVVGLDVGIGDFHVVIVDAVVGQRSQLNLVLGGLTLEEHLGRDGVREETVREQGLVLLDESLVAQVLLDEEPVVVDVLVLLGHLRVVGHLLVLVLELGEHGEVETTRLLVDEGRLEQHGVSTLTQHVLQLFVGNDESQFLGLGLNELVVYISLPNLVTELVHVLFREVVTTLCHLDNIRIFLNELLEILD